MMAEKDNDDSNSNSFAAGRIQLWQFLLKLLVDRTKFSLISWSGTEGEFDILQPDEVARLWSEQKGAKGSGNFANLQRSLRTYYSQGLLTKVAGYQYRYRFTFDSKSFLGYSFEELTNLVMSFESSSAHLLPTLTN